MATELTAAGYRDLRDYIAATWTHIAAREGSTEHLRLPLSDARVTLTSDGENNPVTVTLVLSGDDLDVVPLLPLTVDNTALYKVAEAGSILSGDSFTPFILANADDELTVTHSVEVPQVV